MSRISERLSVLKTQLVNVLGDSVAKITTDPQQVRPLPDKPCIYIEPPSCEALNWHDFDTTWHVNIIAGTQTTGAAALTQIYDLIDVITGTSINVQSAEPTTFSLAGTGNLAAYTLIIKQ